MRKAVITLFSCFFLATGLGGAAYAQELIPGGQAVGVQLSTEGVLVAGLAKVETADGAKSPAAEAGLKKGDIIMSLGGKELESATELIEQVGRAGGEPVELGIEREGRSLSLRIKPVLTDEQQWRLGVWLRDGISGIGTLTFYDPESGIYGALGHGVSDLESGVLLPLEEGHISEAQIVSINKGSSGCPGELNGCADVGKELGSIDKNSENGVYGRLYSPERGRALKTGEIKTGDASILSTIDGRTVEEYEIEINRVYKDDGSTRALLTVTDPRLLSRTGGIVQGMSGSPILQDGRLVGAVTHVLVNDPTRGYGIYIENMLDAAS